MLYPSEVVKMKAYRLLEQCLAAQPALENFTRLLSVHLISHFTLHNQGLADYQI